MEGSGAIAIGPPTRDHDAENFPVASLLLPRAVRPKVLAFYRFVRTADDIADAPAMNCAWDRWLDPTAKPARMTIQAPLVDPAWKVEITGIAALDGGMPGA